MSRLSRRALFLSTVAVALVLGGCGEEEKVDPYVYGTLDQVTRGHVRSEGFLFEIPVPDFVYVKGNTGIARVGNHLEVIVADDLENRVTTWDDSNIIGVQKFFKPYVWLMAKRVKEKMGEEEFSIVQLDSVPDPILPQFTQVDLEEVSGFDLGSLNWNQKQAIDDMFEAEVQGVGEIVQMPDHEAEQPEATEGGEPAEPKMAWYLKAEGSDAMFKITNVTPELEFTFGMLEALDLPFIGGVKIGETYTYAMRRETRVSAPVEITFVRFANRYLAP